MGVFFGLESGSDRTLRAMNKGITSKQMSDFIKGLHSNGIFPAPSLVIGAPGEAKRASEVRLEEWRRRSVFERGPELLGWILERQQ